MGLWTQLLSPGTLPSAAALGAGSKDRARPVPYTGDGASEAQELGADQEGAVLHWLSTLVHLAAHWRPFPLPPTLRMTGGGTGLNQSAAWESKRLILRCPGNQPSLLHPSHCARGTADDREGRMGEFGQDESQPANSWAPRLVGPERRGPWLKQEVWSP